MEEHFAQDVFVQTIWFFAEVCIKTGEYFYWDQPTYILYTLNIIASNGMLPESP